tara:strand:- start:289 stop:516 length:228 start_codon:yes stop_codon:yes gene_type:complete
MPFVSHYSSHPQKYISLFVLQVLANQVKWIPHHTANLIEKALQMKKFIEQAIMLFPCFVFVGMAIVCVALQIKGI